METLERRRALLERPLDREPLDAGAELNTVTTRAVDHELRVGRLDDRRAVRQQEDVGLDRPGEVEVLPAARGGLLQRQGGRVARRAAARDAAMEDEDVG